MIYDSRYEGFFEDYPKMFDHGACANSSCSTKFKTRASMCIMVIL